MSNHDTTPYSRRAFLEFLGRTSLIASTLPAWSLLQGCATTPEGEVTRSTTLASQEGVPVELPFAPIAPSLADDFVLAEGLRYQVLISRGDPISKSLRFGGNNDFLAFFPLQKGNTKDGILWVNHEYPEEIYRPAGWKAPEKRDPEEIKREMGEVGGSLIRINRDRKSGEWRVVQDDRHNRRFDATTPIPLAAPRPILGKKIVRGTFAGCAGGKTPWGSVLSCEENYPDFIGETIHGADGSRTRDPKQANIWFRWHEQLDYEPEHYGWVVEVNPFTGKAKKLTSLGRFVHEGATVTQAVDGRCVVYMGDDGNDRCIYKFIADKPGSLEKGTLYVANIERGMWISLSWQDQPEIRARCKDPLEALIRTREVAQWMGGTPMDRPEDIEVDPKTGAVIVALTNNKPKGRPYGQLLKIVENGGPLSLDFTSSTLIAGGPASGFSCPDNLAFDSKGNLWMVTDMSSSEIGKPGTQEPFGNNGLFYIPMSGPHAGRALQMGSAPPGAELTGLEFVEKEKTLFLSVMHPGENTVDADNITSHWPKGGRSMPLSSVVAITGPLMDRLLSKA